MSLSVTDNIVEHRGLPSMAILEVTKKCNLDCKFCYAPWIDHPDAFGEELPISRWLEIVDYLVAGGVTKVEVTGGEPLLKEDVVELLKNLKSRQEIRGLSLYSNLYAFSDAVLEVVDDPRFTVSTSLQGVSNLTNIVGRSCDAATWRRWCRRIVRTRAKLSVNIAVCKANLPDLDAMLAEADVMGASYIGVGPVLIEGRAKSHPGLWLSFEEMDRLYAKLDACARSMRTPLEIARERFCKCRPDCVKPNGTPHSFCHPDCHVEASTLVVCPDGHYRRCLHTWDASPKPVDQYPI